MKKVIRLTESELANMVRRIIREMDDEMDYESDYQKMSKEDVIDVISDFFLENLNPREVRKIKKIMNDMQSGQSMEMEMGEDLDARKRRQRQNAGIAGGLGMAGVGALAAISHAMGYTDAGDLMVGIHDAIHAVGGKYSGSIGTGMVFAGLGMALNNYVSKSLDSEM
jgi:hypothetical protein